MRDHLIIDLDVPPENITTLLDASATRSAILQNFKALQTNPRIRKGAPILIFFAGHGGLGTASQKCMDKYGHKEIQVIFPYDYEPKYPGPTPKDRNCIPDTTIRALLNGLAKERGNNITVILDSCYSASGDRTHTVAGRIARDAEVEVEVSCDIDVDVTSPALLAELQSSKDSRSPQLPLHTDQASHVLLAAAGSHQKAWEESRRGNFTKELLAGIRAVGGANKITYENLITSLRKLPGDQTPHCYGRYKSRVLFNLDTSRSHETPFIQAEFVRDTWILQAGEASGVTFGSLWALYLTEAEDSQPIGHLQVLDRPGVSSSALKPVTPGPSFTVRLNSVDGDRMYARQVQPGAGEELRVYFSPEAESLIFGSRSSNSTQPTPKAAPGEIGYVQHIARDSADVAVEDYRSKSTPGSPGSEVTFTLSMAKRYQEAATLEHRTQAGKKEVDRVLLAAARWHWHMRRGKSSTGSKSRVSLEFMKLGVLRGEHIVSSEGQSKNLINEKGVAEIKVKQEDQYGIKILNQRDDELYVRVFYFSASDFSVLDMFGHNKANGRSDPDVPKRGQRIIGDNADGGSLLSFALEPGQRLELGYIKVFWSTNPLELDDVAQGSPFDGAHQEGRVPIMTTPGQWGAELITLLQRA